MKEVDILVVGGGMAGLAFACALDVPNLRVAVVDKHAASAPESWPETFDPRVSALSKASEHLLRNVGAWDIIEQQRFAPYVEMSVWDGQGIGQIEFHADSLGESHLGAIVENRVTQHALTEIFHQQHKGEFISAGTTGISADGERWIVTLDNGDKISTTLLVGADGAQSVVREQAGLSVRRWAYEQTAIVTTVTTEKTHRNVARQIFLETGPLAFLPLRQTPSERSSKISSIVWSANTAEAERLMALDDAAFAKALEAAFEHRLGEVVALDRRFSFPLVQQHAVDYVQSGLALIGDAAHTIHPLAGQGINLGFLDAAVLAEEISSAVKKQLSPGEWLVLRRYQRRRKSHNLATMATMEGFKRLFSPQHWGVHALRNAGMRILNRHTFIKNKVVAQAMGLEGDLPQIAQPAMLVDF